MDEVRQILNAVKIKQQIVDPKSGAELFGPIPSSNNMFFLERFPGLSKEECTSLKKSYRGDIPNEYLHFLQITNGANILGRVLKIAGVGYDPQKYRNCKVPDPIQFVDIHRTSFTPHDWLFFATYTQWKNVGMAHACIDCSISSEEKPVYCLPYDGDEILKTWKSFEDWFVSELNRLYLIYQKNSYELIDIVPGVVQAIQLLDES